MKYVYGDLTSMIDAGADANVLCYDRDAKQGELTKRLFLLMTTQLKEMYNDVPKFWHIAHEDVSFLMSLSNRKIYKTKRLNLNGDLLSYYNSKDWCLASKYPVMLDEGHNHDDQKLIVLEGNHSVLLGSY